LNLLEGFDVAAWGRHGRLLPSHRRAVEVACADRDEWLTDPAFVNIPLERLLSKAYASERRALID
jgi:gamma-glutamyltranspeptidase/glutathione hydrolase